MKKAMKVTILDFGGQYNQLIARRVRELGVYCEIRPCTQGLDTWCDDTLGGVFMTGVENRKAEADTARAQLAQRGVPVLVIEDGREFRPAAGEKGDVPQSLKGFLFDACGLTPSYKPEDQIEQMTREIKEQVGDGKVVAALSGGVDSSVCAVLASKALSKSQLTCVFVDHGLLRLHEAKQVMQTYRDKLGLDIVHIDAEDRFLTALKGVVEPEKKRQIIGEMFVRIFEEKAREVGGQFLLQGTIYPDIIESGVGSAKTIKSHHNVGGMPKDSLFPQDKLVEPLRFLFKDEVRKIGETLGIPREMLWRQPFPGPGLAVRCIGELLKPRLDLLRQCDWIYRDEIEKAGLSDSIWQYFAVLTGTKTVGISGEDRTYAECVALRAVNTEDAMTADVIELPYDLLGKIMRRIIQECPGVNRVVYDITQKPPGTIEWE